MIKPTCDKCGNELTTFGGLAFSAPDTKPDGSAFRCVDKYHLCVMCFESFKSWLDYSPDDTGKVLLTKEQWEQAQRDKARLEIVDANKWCVIFNGRIHAWTVQGYQQVVGCIGKGRTMREAIDDAARADTKGTPA